MSANRVRVTARTELGNRHSRREYSKEKKTFCAGTRGGHSNAVRNEKKSEQLSFVSIAISGNHFEITSTDKSSFCVMPGTEHREMTVKKPLLRKFPQFVSRFFGVLIMQFILGLDYPERHF